MINFIKVAKHVCELKIYVTDLLAPWAFSKLNIMILISDIINAEDGKIIESIREVAQRIEMTLSKGYPVLKPGAMTLPY